jgi:hypothetical protein
VIYGCLQPRELCFIDLIMSGRECSQAISRDCIVLALILYGSKCALEWGECYDYVGG